MARLYQKPAVAATSQSSTTSGSLLWTWLICGLLVTVINVFYEAGTTLETLHISRFDPVQGNLVLEGTQERKGNFQNITEKNVHEHTSLQVDQIGMTWESIDSDIKRDKGPILKLVLDAGLLESVSREAINRLPSWSEVTELYGNKPRIIGLNNETCAAFQKSPNASWHFLSTAGSFNTGTNLMSELLIANCHMPLHEKLPEPYGGPGVRWQVLWGKHTPVDNEEFRITHRTYSDPNLNARNIFPAVMVRDPMRWMQAMCRHAYSASWTRDEQDESHCPNLVSEDGGTMNVTVTYAEFTREHSSLVEFWNEWYQAYFEARFPRLIVRFEDLIFHPKQVVNSVCRCAGGELYPKAAEHFHYVTDSAKQGDSAHGKKSLRTSYLDALIRYGSKDGRFKGYKAADLEYAKRKLNHKYMEALAYSPPRDPEREAGT